MQPRRDRRHLAFAALFCAGCLSPGPSTLGTALSSGNGPRVRFDAYHLPFADIPLPNNFATVYDASSPTERRLNASILAGTTTWEQKTRASLDALNGWGTLAPITVAFEAPIDPEVIYARHFDATVDFSDDAVFVIDVTPGSPDYCQPVPLDVGQGNYPEVLAQQQQFDSDPRGTLQTALFEETEEDVNGNGIFDPGEDTDSDGVFDHPNTRDGKPGSLPMLFYERETDTLIMKPLMPMRERTTYAAVLTKRLTDTNGNPVRSPFDGINDASQTRELQPLPECLTHVGLSIDDVAFAWSFTTQDLTSDYKKVRDGLYGLGELAQVGTDFPATLAAWDDVRDPGPGIVNLKLAPGSALVPVISVLSNQIRLDASKLAVIAATYRNVDVIASGVINSPQFFPRTDESGAPLPFYDQVWDLTKPPRSEGVPFLLFLPKNRTGPVPLAIFIHGLGGAANDGALLAGVVASFGVATLAIDAPSHGVGVTPDNQKLVVGAFQSQGISGLAGGVLRGRAVDYNHDGVVDSGADYYSGYIFHTRDMLRQTMVDTMQVVRTLRAFDGKATWAFDPLHTGHPGLAGDFDGDGIVDIGGSASINFYGSSLGGITGALISGLEPGLDATVDILSGGVPSEIATRAILPPVHDGVMLRLFGPIFYEDSGKLMVHINDAVDNDIQLALGDMPAATPGDMVVLHNHKNGVYRCGVIQPSGTFRVSVSCDEGDPLELRFYKGPLPPQPLTGCVEPSTAPYADITTLGQDVPFDGNTLPKGTQLTALTDGFGERRSTPDLRRLLQFAQVALEPADPMNFAASFDGTRPMVYGNGESVHTNVLLMVSDGDPVVVADAGIALARAAGFISYDTVDPRWGVPANQELIDIYATEGTSRLGRYRDPVGNPVLIDVEDLESTIPGADDGWGVPRLSPPMRLVHQNADASWSGVMIPMLAPQGVHTFPIPDPDAGFDVGTYLNNVMGRYLQTSGAAFSYDGCQATSTCAWATFPLK